MPYYRDYFHHDFYYILKDRVPVPVTDMMEWSRWYEHADDERIVGQEHIGMLFVSTVFLGLNHNFSGAGRPPILFETMIFADRQPIERGPEGQIVYFGGGDILQRRYHTWDEAEHGHKVALRYARLRWTRIELALAVALEPERRDV